MGLFCPHSKLRSLRKNSIFRVAPAKKVTPRLKPALILLPYTGVETPVSLRREFLRSLLGLGPGLTDTEVVVDRLFPLLARFLVAFVHGRDVLVPLGCECRARVNDVDFG